MDLTTRFGLILIAITMFLIQLVNVPAVAAAQATTTCPTTYELPGQQVFPEGIAAHRETGDFFVSSAADGTIFRGNVGQPVLQPFLAAGGDGRTGALGLELDGSGRLFIAGAMTGRLFVYDTATGLAVGTFDTGSAPASFVNDVTVTPSGDAYFTDSFSPYLYRLTPDGQSGFTFERFIDFTGSPIVYSRGADFVSGINLNGIVSSADGRYLVVAQTNTKKLFRIAVADKTITPIEVQGTELAGDGLLLDGQTLYVVNESSSIAVVQLTADFTSGTVRSTLTDPSFKFPTTITRVGTCLLVVNAQFDKQAPNLSPELPFTISSVPLPTATTLPPRSLPDTGALVGLNIFTAWLVACGAFFLAIGTFILRRSRYHAPE